MTFEVGRSEHLEIIDFPDTPISWASDFRKLKNEESIGLPGFPQFVKFEADAAISLELSSIEISILKYFQDDGPIAEVSSNSVSGRCC